MDKPLIISIIIPVYNVETYLGSCIRSVLAQTFSNFELILVDDGSTDGSGIICDEYAATDSRIRVIHQVNRGVSSARNAGIETALGEYIGFVDGDDWIEPDMYALLHRNSVTYGAELSACGFIKIKDYSAIMFQTKVTPPQCYTPEEAICAMFRQNHMRYSACNKLFRRSLFDAVRYPEGRTMEDKGTTYQLIHRSTRIVWCASPKYHYFMRPGSIMHSEFNERMIDLFIINDELLEFIETHYAGLKAIAESSYAAECVKLLLCMKKSHYYDADTFEKCIACIRKNMIRSVIAPSAGSGNTLLVLFAALHPDGFRFKD